MHDQLNALGEGEWLMWFDMDVHYMLCLNDRGSISSCTDADPR